jgi:hypothetical protein
MHEKHHRLVDDVLRRMDVLGIKRTVPVSNSTPGSITTLLTRASRTFSPNGTNRFWT